MRFNMPQRDVETFAIMNCYLHPSTPAVGMCAACQRGVCRDCVGRDTPRVICRTCLDRGGAVMFGFEYRSPVAVGSWPLVHICSGIDPITMRPRMARGVIAIGNIAVGVVALGGLACGLFTLGGLSIGLLFALGGMALGTGLSVGGVSIGSIALGGLAVGFSYAIGATAVGPAVLSVKQCDQAAAEFLRHWFGSLGLPRNCP